MWYPIVRRWFWDSSESIGEVGTHHYIEHTFDSQPCLEDSPAEQATDPPTAIAPGGTLLDVHEYTSQRELLEFLVARHRP